MMRLAAVWGLSGLSDFGVEHGGSRERVHIVNCYLGGAGILLAAGGPTVACHWLWKDALLPKSHMVWDGEA